VCTVAATAVDYYNKPGNILISDQFNNRVLEVDPETNEIVWSCGDGSSIAGPPRWSRPTIFNGLAKSTSSPAQARPPEAILSERLCR
jgi:hypothetical protein